MSAAADNPLFSLTPDEAAFVRESYALRDSTLSPYATRYDECVRERDESRREQKQLIRNPFTRDVTKIIYTPFFNRAADKTQVFSFQRNSDITHRSLHVTLVSRIARTIGQALRLNIDLIEAISLGHDIGHTPFGHTGEKYLSDLYHGHTGRYFNHNVHSVRVLKTISPCNLSLQTYSGILSHCGEKEFSRYEPGICDDFAALDEIVESCYEDQRCVGKLRANTLEGCVVRIADIIAYLGKDRQDAMVLGASLNGGYTNAGVLGTSNADIIGNITANVVKNSIDEPYLCIDEEVRSDMKRLRTENMELIYTSEDGSGRLHDLVLPMFQMLYERLREDVTAGRENSPIYRDHIKYPYLNNRYNDYGRRVTDPDELVVDYLASVTDDYLVALFRHLFPDNPLAGAELYKGFFE